MKLSRWSRQGAEALRDAVRVDVNSEMVRQLDEALLEHVCARLQALPPGWRVATQLNPVERTIGRMDASWTVRAVGPSDHVPNGWTIYGPLPKPYDTERQDHG